jgi:DNA-binding transcriptional regulator YdaS (Cro superfamily)
MTREELVEVVGHLLADGRTAGADGVPRIGRQTQKKARQIITALCAALGISDAALAALAKGEACVVPNAAIEKATQGTVALASTELRRENTKAVIRAFIRRLNKEIAASPYAARDAEGGA